MTATTTTATAKRYRIVDSPLGPLTLAGDDQLTDLRMDGQAHEPDRSEWVVDPDAFADAIVQLDEYFAGRLTTFEIDLRLDGTAFQREVWAALRTIAYGETWSYARLAERVGRPSAFRAVGSANGRNPIAIVVPCHRVVAADGSLGGYAGGLDRKRLLLDLEHH